MTELELLIETEYCGKDAKEDTHRLVLVKVNLPILRNPLSDIFHETLAGPGYCLSDRQIRELRELSRTGEIKLIFLLDACRSSYRWPSSFLT